MDLNPIVEDIGCIISKTMDAWCNNPFGLVIWQSHGGSNIAEYVIKIDDVPNLNDSFPSVIWSVSCHNGKPEDINNLGYSILKNGGIGVVSASREGWYYMGESDYTNTTSGGGMGYQFSNCMANNKSIGESLFYTKHFLLPGIWKNYISYNLYGDPSVNVFSSVPDFTVSTLAKNYRFSGVKEEDIKGKNYTYNLKNHGSIPINWTVTGSGSDWLSVSLNMGIINVGESTDVVVTLTQVSNYMALDTYHKKTLIFTDMTNDITEERDVNLLIRSGKPLGHWSLNNVESYIIYDNSNYNNIGYYGDECGWSDFACDPVCVEGRLGDSLYFSGDDYIIVDSIGDDIYSNNLTINAWIKTTEWQGDIFACDWPLVGNDILGNDIFGFGIIAGYVTIDDPYPETYSVTRVNDNQWHMITYVRNGMVGKIYVDGFHEATHEANFELGVNLLWSIGQQWKCYAPDDFRLDNFYTGYLDDIRFYNYPLTQEKIDKLYNFYCDFEPDGDTDLIDIYLFTLDWLEQGCNVGNEWCMRRDLNKDGKVNLLDYLELASLWSD